MTTMPLPPPSPWSQQTKDRFFFAALIAALVAVLYLFSPFFFILLFAVVVVVVSTPMFDAILRAVGRRRTAAALLTTTALALLVIGPLAFLGYLFVQESLTVVASAVAFVKSGQLQAWLTWATDLSQHSEKLPSWMVSYIPKDFDIVDSVAGPLQDALLSGLNAAGTTLPGLLNRTIDAGVNFVLFVFAVITMYIEGPRLQRVIHNLAPMEDTYVDRLIEVFVEIANNLVIGSLLTAAAMSVVAGIGYEIAGVDRALFYAILTGVMSFVPVVGSALVWVPIGISVGMSAGWGWGAFVLIWSGVLTTHVDTFLRPMLMRGKTNIHPLLIFLAVFGGMAWMGVPGAVVGPLIVAAFLALYTIYCEDYLGIPTIVHATPPPGFLHKLLARIMPKRAETPPPG